MISVFTYSVNMATILTSLNFKDVTDILKLHFTGQVNASSLQVWNEEKISRKVEVYTKDGEFVRNTLIPNERIGELHRMVVITEGRIAVACGELHYYPGKVLVI